MQAERSFSAPRRNQRAGSNLPSCRSSGGCTVADLPERTPSPTWKLAQVDRGRKDYSRAERVPKWSVHPAGRGIVRELNDRSSDAAPHGRPVLVAGGLELVGSGSAFLERLVAIPLEHELRRPPNVDLRDHAPRLHIYSQ
jgi:hypothetical protein